MRSIATDVARRVVCVSVCVCDTRMNHAKTAELIEMLFVGRTRVSPRKHVLDGLRFPHGKRQSCGLSGPWKSTASLCCGLRSTSLIQPSTTASQRHCCSRLQCSRLVDVTLHCPPCKIRPCDAAFRQNSLSTCFTFVCLPSCTCIYSPLLCTTDAFHMHY